MLAHALSERPNECCGLLSGRKSDDGTVAEVSNRYPLVNERASPREFVSEPKGMFAAVKEMRREGIEILAVYHSHPSSAPIPSKRDLEDNYSPTVMNLILGLAGDSPDVRGWWLTETAQFAGSFEVSEPASTCPRKL